MDRLSEERSVHVLQPSKIANVSDSVPSIVQLLSDPTSIHPVFPQVALPAAPAPVYQQASRSTDNTTLNTSEKGADSVTVASNSIMNEKNASSSSIEKGYKLAWEGYQDDILPEKTQSRFLRNLRHQVFSLYRRLFGVVMVTNMAIFIATLIRGSTNAQQLGLIVVANLFCAILMRQDYVINAFFTVLCAVPPS
jgi:hypothetical protein